MKKLFLLFTMTFILIGLVSAGVKTTFESNDDKINHLNTKTQYGKYIIEETKWWDLLKIGSTEKIKEIELIENTDECSDNCFAIKEVTNLKPMPLIEDVRFFRDFGDGNWILWNGFTNWKIEVEEDIDIFETSCKEGKEITDEKNGTSYTEQICEQVKVRTEKQWRPLDYKKDYEGTYKVKLSGGKKDSTILDWEVKMNGVWSDKWSVWGNTSEGDEAEVVLNSPANGSIVYDNPVTFNASATVTGGAYLINATLYDNSTGSWEGRNTSILSSGIGADGLVSYYTLDETSGTTAIDSVGNNNLTHYGGVLVNQTGKISRAVYYDGSNDYSRQVGNIAAVNSVTYNFWIYSDGTTGMIYKNVYSPSVLEFIGIKNGGKMGYVFAAGSGSTNEWITNNNLPTNQWVMVTIKTSGSANSGSTQIYFNNTLQATTFGTQGTNRNRPSGSNTGYFGLDEAGWGDYASRYKGYLDEFNIWEKSLTESEITNLYNGGVGQRPGEGTSATVTFNNTYPVGSNILWNMQFCDSDGDCGFAVSNRTFSMDVQPPTINITSPLTSYNYLYSNQTLDLNWSVEDGAGHLDSCWYEYNGTNNSVTCNDNTTTFNYIPNVNNLTFYANDTLGNLGSELRSWSVNILELNKTYNNLTYDTADEYFYYYLNYNSSLINPTIILNYEGINYTSINLGTGDFGVFRSKVTIPLVNSTNNNTFKWIIRDNGNTEESINSTQTVNPIVLTLCNATYSNKVLNFTYFDESNTLPIDASLNSTNINSYFKYWIGDGSVIKEYNYERLNAPTNNYTFCISPYNNSNFTIKSDLELEYSASGYSEREYYFIEKELFNSSETISLYLLKDTLGTKFFHYVRQEIESVPNVLVEIQKFFISTGTFQKIGLKKTDNEGRFVEWLEQDKRYKYIITSAEGINLSEIEKTAICAVTPCEITLQIEEVTLDLFRELEAYFAENVDYNLTYNKTTGYITLNFLDETGTATYWRLNVYKSNFRNESIETICNKFAYSSAGTLDCDISGTMGEITAKVYISRSPEKLVDFLLVVNETITPAVGSSGLLASIIILLIIIFTGSRNPSNALIMIPFGLIILKLIGFMPLTWGWVVGITVFILLIMSRMKT